MALRLYTGPTYKPWNDWLRYGDGSSGGGPIGDGDGNGASKRNTGSRQASASGSAGGGSAVPSLCHTDDWSTSLAVLYNAIIKLSTSALPGAVYRGVREDQVRLPDFFIPEEGCPADGTGAGELLSMHLLGRLPNGPSRFSGGVERGQHPHSSPSVHPPCQLLCRPRMLTFLSSPLVRLAHLSSPCLAPPNSPSRSLPLPFSRSVHEHVA